MRPRTIMIWTVSPSEESKPLIRRLQNTYDAYVTLETKSRESIAYTIKVKWSIFSK